MSILDRVTNFLFGSEIARRVNLAVRALDDPTDRQVGAGMSRDRFSYDRQTVLKDSFEAWRSSPLGRRIVELTSDYVVGGGLAVSSKHAGTHKFLQAFWTNRLNKMQTRAFDWCDELTRAGDLFPILSTDAAGMSYLRAIPASEIESIDSAKNDVEQETIIYQKNPDGGDPLPWQVYDPLTDARDESGQFPSVMLHYSINRPIGAKFGEGDLGPLVKWIVRYGGWLEDRVRLNKFRQVFMWIVSKAWKNDAERKARQNELNTNPPNPGSILVKDDTETWGVEHPKLDSFEASEDGSSIKKMIALGAGVPTHFLGEPEGSTRTTAESAGGATFRHYQRRQLFFLAMIFDLCQVVATRRAMVDSKVKADAKIEVTGTDISPKDNTQLSMAATQIVNAFKQLYDDGLIDGPELLRLCYTFAGEVVDVDQILKDGEAWKTKHPKQPTQPNNAPHSTSVAP